MNIIRMLFALVGLFFCFMIYARDDWAIQAEEEINKKNYRFIKKPQEKQLEKLKEYENKRIVIKEVIIKSHESFLDSPDIYLKYNGKTTKVSHNLKKEWSVTFYINEIIEPFEKNLEILVYDKNEIFDDKYLFRIIIDAANLRKKCYYGDIEKINGEEKRGGEFSYSYTFE